MQIAAAAFSPDNKYLATSFTAGRMLVTLWEVASTEKNALGVVSDNDYRLTAETTPAPFSFRVNWVVPMPVQSHRHGTRAH